LRREIEFKSGGDTIRGWFYTPDDGEGPFPTVMLAGGWCYVKEIVQPVYAEMYAEAGIASVLFDYRNFGESDGDRRQHLNPFDQIDDYKCAIDFAETLDEVDNDRIGVWGISYSGGHSLIVGASDSRVKCIASQIPVIDGYTTMRLIQGTFGFRDFKDLLLEDRRSRRDTGKDGYLPHTVLEDEVSTWPVPEATEIFRNLKANGAERYENKSTIESAELLMQYYVEPYLERILDTPTLVVVAEGDDYTMWEQEIGAYNKIPTDKKKLVVIPDSTHMSLYEDQTLLSIAATAATEWFSEHLVEPYRARELSTSGTAG
jgi:fermentation-respiration switch protein FrsA (DUF1100 family)